MTCPAVFKVADSIPMLPVIQHMTVQTTRDLCKTRHNLSCSTWQVRKFVTFPAAHGRSYSLPVKHVTCQTAHDRSDRLWPIRPHVTCQATHDRSDRLSPIKQHVTCQAVDDRPNSVWPIMQHVTCQAVDDRSDSVWPMRQHACDLSSSTWQVRHIVTHNAERERSSSTWQVRQVVTYNFIRQHVTCQAAHDRSDRLWPMRQHKAY